MKFRVKKTGEVKHLEIERIRMVVLTNVDDWFDTYDPSSDGKMLELVEATPREVRALRRAGIRVARPKDNAALRQRGKRARANARKRATMLAQSIESTNHRRAA